MNTKLSSKQKKIAIIYTLLLILILGLEYYHINFAIISWIRFLTMLSLAVVIVWSRTEEHFKKVSIVFVLIVVGDFFLVLGNIIGGFEHNFVFLGFVPFSLAYIFLTFIYLKSYKLNIKDVLLAIPFLVLALLLYRTLNQFIEGIFLKGASLVLLIVLLIMAWSSVLFLFKDTFPKNRSIMLAISGILMLACDLGVGFDLFYPDFYLIRNLIPINLVWLFYLPGWVLLAIASTES